MSDFAQFLQEYKTKMVGKSALFNPDPQQWIIGVDPGLKAIPRLPILEALVQAEARLECKLPSGYRTFMELLGPGFWGQAQVWHPDYLFKCDESNGEMLGYVSLASNVDGFGNYVAFHPSDQRIYYWAHDPFGYAHVSDTFEHWIESLTESIINNPKVGARDFYFSLPDFIECKAPSETHETTSRWPQITKDLKQRLKTLFGRRNG